MKSISFHFLFLFCVITSQKVNPRSYYPRILERSSSLDIHTQSNLAEVEIISLVQELIPRYRLRAETDFACSNQDFIQTPRIDGSEFDALTNTQIRALLDYYSKILCLTFPNVIQ